MRIMRQKKATFTQRTRQKRSEDQKMKTRRKLNINGLKEVGFNEGVVSLMGVMGLTKVTTDSRYINLSIKREWIRLTGCQDSKRNQYLHKYRHLKCVIL